MPTANYTVMYGEILSEDRSGTKRDYVPDCFGTTVALLDNTQTLTDTFTYWPYGEVKTRVGTSATPFQFLGTRGYYQDTARRDYAPGTELLVSRYYDCSLGRYDSEGFVYLDEVVNGPQDLPGSSIPGIPVGRKGHIIITGSLVGYQDPIWGIGINPRYPTRPIGTVGGSVSSGNAKYSIIGTVQPGNQPSITLGQLITEGPFTYQNQYSYVVGGQGTYIGTIGYIKPPFSGSVIGTWPIGQPPTSTIGIGWEPPGNWGIGVSGSANQGSLTGSIIGKYKLGGNIWGTGTYNLSTHSVTFGIELKK